ncbi:MAG: IS1 family transposase [Thermodesulfovibrionales bacterium]
MFVPEVKTKNVRQNNEVMDVTCPTCHSNAVYRYGKNRSGRQRYICLICNKQFVPGIARFINNNPVCPSCGRQMHRYKNEDGFLRYRCSDYPKCRTFLKKQRKS